MNDLAHVPTTARPAEWCSVPTGKYLLRLFVAGLTPRSTDAIVRVKAMCDEHLKGHYELEVIDIYQQPGMAQAEQIIATPTLIRQLPLPLRRLVGDFSDTRRVLAALSIREG